MILFSTLRNDFCLEVKLRDILTLLEKKGNIHSNEPRVCGQRLKTLGAHLECSQHQQPPHGPRLVGPLYAQSDNDALNLFLPDAAIGLSKSPDSECHWASCHLSRTTKDTRVIFAYSRDIRGPGDNVWCRDSPMSRSSRWSGHSWWWCRGYGDKNVFSCEIDLERKECKGNVSKNYVAKTHAKSVISAHWL